MEQLVQHDSLTLCGGFYGFVYHPSAYGIDLFCDDSHTTESYYAYVDGTSDTIHTG